MGAEIKNYKVVLTVLGPVFIGSGKTINKNEYLYSKYDNCVYILDQYKMFEGLRKHQLLKDYEKLMLTDYYKDNLFNLLRERQVPKAEYGKWARYTLQLDDLDLSRNSLKSIHTFVKDAYDCPYIPGSSLKGAIRTAIIDNAVEKDKKGFYHIASDIKKAKVQNKKYYLKDEIEKIETKVLHSLTRTEKRRDIQNDCFSGFRVSDSKPLEVSNLTLCQKVDISTKSTKGFENKLNIMRECLKPGTQIEFEIEVDVQAFGFDMDEFLEYVKVEYRQYEGKFLSEFSELETRQIQPQGAYLYLGGGCGFHTKTILSSLYEKEEMVQVTSQIIDNTLSLKAKKEHKHYLDTKKHRMSPHTRKCTYYEGKLMDMGLCEIAIEPMQ